MPLWQLPLHRSFGRRGEGWGDGEYIASGDEVVKWWLYWVLDNQSKQAVCAKWNIVLPLQFSNGADLVAQDAKVLYLYTGTMLQQRKMLSDLSQADYNLIMGGVDEQDDDGWWLTNHIGSVGLGCNWLPAKLAGRTGGTLSTLNQDSGKFRGVVRLITERPGLGEGHGALRGCSGRRRA